MAKPPHPRVVALWFAVACAGVAWVGVASFWGNRGLVQSFGSVTQSHQAVSKLNALQALMEGAEASVSNFTITGSATRLAPYWRAQSQVPKQLRDLRFMLQDPPQRKALKRLDRLLRSHLSYLSRVITVREKEGFDAAARWLDAEDTSSPREAMNQLLKEVEKMAGAEVRERSTSTQATSLRQQAALALAALLTLGFVFWGFGLLRRESDVRVQAENATERMQTFLNRIIDRIPYMILVKEVRGLRLTLVNKAAAEWLGRSEKDLLGSNAYDLMPREKAREEMTADMQILRQGDPVDLEEILTLPGQEERILHTQKVVIHDEAGRPAFLLTISEDITQRKHAEKIMKMNHDAAVESERLKAEFLRNMSHEFRTPLALVIGMTALLLDTELQPEQKKFGESIKRAADNLSILTKGILDFSKIESGSFVLDHHEVNVRQTVEDVVRMVQEQAKSKGIGLASLITNDLPMGVLGDGARLRQVLIQLIGNAVKFTQRGEVIVRVTESKQDADNLWLTYRVTDTGIGIEKDLQKHLFEPFRQGDGSRTRKFGGTGLGLAMAKRIVELMGGDIGFESRAGEGSSFWCTIPFKKRQSQGPVVAMTSMPWTRARVLIVDESETVRQLLKRQLNAWALSSEEVATGEAALAMLAREQKAGRAFPIVLTDLHLPDMDGMVLARTIKQDAALGGTKILVMSSAEAPLDPQSLSPLGFSGWLPKPPKPDALHEALARMIEVPSSPTDHPDHHQRAA